MKPIFHTTSSTWSPIRTSVRRTNAARSCSVVQANAWELFSHNEPLFELSDGFQPELGREVHIKRLRPFAAANPRLWNDFTQEMRATAQIRHPNLVQVYEAHLQDDQPYVVLERLYGPTLQQRIEQLWNERNSIQISEACEIVLALANFVEFAHRRNARVYSIRPDQIVLTEGNNPVLSGLGSAPSVPAHSLSSEEVNFLAPEYLAGSIFDRRSDVYSLGILLALLLTGRLPFESDTETILMQKQRSSLPLLEQPARVALLPTSLVAVLQRATAPNPDNRYSSAAELENDLVAILDQVEELPTAADSMALPSQSFVPVVEAKSAVTVPSLPMDVSTSLTEAEVKNTAAESLLPMDNPMLIPGMEREEFQAALPYVVLVPLPTLPELPEVVPAAASTTANGGLRLNAQIWMLLILTIVVTISAALTLG